MKKVKEILSGSQGAKMEIRSWVGNILGWGIFGVIKLEHIETWLSIISLILLIVWSTINICKWIKNDVLKKRKK